MPGLSRGLVRTSLLYLLAGFTLGALLLIEKGLGHRSVLWRTLPAHREFLIFGWVVQLTMGVAYWILPRFSRGPPRGNVAAAWSAYGLLNLGVLLVAVDPLLELAPVLTVVGRACEAAAALAFGLHAWPRVKPTQLPPRS